MTTDNLALPYIAASQDQKHITHNEALRMLDALVHLTITDKNLASPPLNPSDGERYLVSAGANGAWAGQDGQLAAWQYGAWVFYSPQPGWRAWVVNEGMLYVFDGTDWTSVLQTASVVGVNTTADPTNRLAVRSAASLFSHEGAGHQVKVNKQATGDTASFLFQTNWSGRAEIGLTGSDAFAFKVSADGSSWHQALSFEPSSGAAEFGAPAKLKQYAVAGLPSASGAGSGALVYVYDASGGAVPAFSDGGNWRRCDTRAIVS